MRGNKTVRKDKIYPYVLKFIIKIQKERKFMTQVDNILV